MTKACIEKYNGYPAIMIDGKPYPPMTATITTSGLFGGDSKKRIIDEQYYRSLGEAGIKIFYVMCNNIAIEEDAISQFDSEAAAILKAVSDAYIIARISLHPSAKWVSENPDEVVSYSDKSQIPTLVTSEAIAIKMDGMYSLCSSKWRVDAGKALLETIKLLEKLPYADRIVGYFLAGGGTSEWYYINSIQNYSTGAYADTSKAFQREFKDFLDRKYGENVVKPIVPDIESRFYTEKIDYEVANPPRRRAAEPAPPPPSNGTNHGSFLDIDKYPQTYDFYRAWHEGTANSIIYFAKLIKEHNSDLLVGAFYGSMGGSEIIWASNGAGVLRVLDSGSIDFLANPGVYENRQPGGFTGQRQCPDSFRLRNTMYIVEEDTRTHAENSYFADLAEMFTLDDTINVLKRDFGRNVCEDLQAWWFDQHVGGGRYKYSEVYRLFEKQQKIASFAYSADRTKKSEIAFIYDEESVHTASKQTTSESVELIRNYEIAKIGAPVDSYFHNDMANDAMPDYKLYVFWNTYYLSTRERAAIKRKLAKNSAVALFMYGSGLINPDADKMLDVAHMSEFTGIECRELAEQYSPKFKVLHGVHALTDNLDDAKLFGTFDHLRRGSVGFIPLYMYRSYLYPVFYTQDEHATVAARFAGNSLPAVAVKETDGYTSVFCGTKYISHDFLREAARFAGCHIYEENGNVLYANKNFITVHAANSGEVCLNLPQNTSPYELYEGKTYASNVKQLRFNMKKGETKMFYIGKDSPPKL